MSCLVMWAVLVSRLSVWLQTLQRAMLPVLLKLLHLPRQKGSGPVALVLKGLLEVSPAMQKAANDMDAVSSLITLMHHQQTWQTWENNSEYQASDWHPCDFCYFLMYASHFDLSGK